MTGIPEPYMARIQEIQPDLKIRSARANHEGLVNDVVIINEETVFRFVKDEAGAQALSAELQVLQAIHHQVSLKIPDPFYTSREVIAYPLIPGEPLTREILIGLSETQIQFVADQIGKFLRALHQTGIDESLPASTAPVSYEDRMALYREVEVRVFPLLMAHQVDWARELFERMLEDRANFDYQPRLIHGDLGAYHILFDREKGRINGVLDFGVAGIGDPAIDFGNLLQVYGERFVRRTLRVYPKASALLKRARFHAQAIELEWALKGITSGDTLWFLAHLGGARDLIW